MPSAKPNPRTITPSTLFIANSLFEETTLTANTAYFRSSGRPLAPLPPVDRREIISPRPDIVTIRKCYRQVGVHAMGGRMSDSPTRQELRNWTKAHRYWHRAAEFLELAKAACDLDVQSRYVTIAQHYRTLAEAEERGAEQKGIERRSQYGASTASSSPP